MRDTEDLQKELFAKRPAAKKIFDELEEEYALIDQIILRRSKENITQAELARRMGTKQSVISRFESGSENPTLEFLRKLCKALGAKLSVTVS